MVPVRAVLIDIDGVLTVSWKALPGAVEALQRIRTAGQAVTLLTNTTSRTRASIAHALVAEGFPVDAQDILTAPAATAAYLAEHHPGARCSLLNSGDIRDDLSDVTLLDEDDAVPDVVIVGGAGPEFDHIALNRVFGHLQQGARLVAMHRNLYWRTDRGLQLDTGAYLVGLERAARTEAEITGKPAAAFFETALARLGVRPDQALMVGDDIESDVLAAQRAGITGVLVKTGKYLPEALDAASGTPDHLLESFADLPALLDRLASADH
ncbi:HAD-IIA family hydrolase [Streptomyces sp. NPDC051320]|uniref:HAD-IIA family hydrolase n=1 Tax=Streptomyces sp. NPDC051320 TaxID=3154644 RepID=UPI003421C3F0